jgi:hypothetical protein
LRDALVVEIWLFEDGLRVELTRAIRSLTAADHVELGAEPSHLPALTG